SGTLPNINSSEPYIEGTVKFGSSEDEHFDKGKVNGQFVNGFPAKFQDKIDDAMMARGQRQYKIYCAVCHGTAGYGDGMVHRVATERAAGGDLSLWVPPKSFHDPLIASKPDGELFDTITWGKNKMMGYGYRLTPEDRWAIVLYVRALQKSGR
ncbi:MAG TPA: cytochrome c, partial [Gemmatales bacterium]|nr:cytochrome c [Gemmatales bacterium]